MIRVAILDDHLMVLKGIETMLQGHESVKVVSTFSTGKDLEESLEKGLFDVLLLDINLPDSNGIDLCKSISRAYPDIRIIGLSNFSETGFIKNMMRNGAKGYLLKNTSKDELVNAIEEVHNGNTFISPELNQKILNESLGNHSDSFIPKLTRREKEILQCISQEMTNQEMADSLFISIKTVESHRNNLL